MIVAKRRSLGGWWGAPIYFLAPAVILFVVLFAIPTVSSLYVCLCKWTGFTPQMEFTGLRNFGKLLGNSFPLGWREAGKWSIPYVALVLCCGGLLFGAALKHKTLRARKFFWPIILVPLLISTMGCVTLWKLIVDSRHGLALGLSIPYAWFEGGDARFWLSIRNNLWIMSVGGVFFFSFALLFAAALNNKNLRGRKFFQTMIFFPSFISVVGVATFWKLIYDSKSGLINLALRGLGGEGVQWLAADIAINSVIIMMIWAGVGGTMILLLAGMRRIPTDYYEAAEIDGASAPQQFFHVTLPMMREVIIIALSLWMIGSMRVFGYIQALLAPDIKDAAQVISTLQYEYAFSNRQGIFMMGRATAMAVVQVILVLILVWIVRRFRERKSVEY
ncbi:hypothetical protein LCGC14_2062380 [marine sediment metagenome]|uniref:ABC transmembrane type-1 domain-containing protein n=1 Tax=marine sediment metagenome TaxID=412755 RepID=A0A0F9EKP1_9ZZZZ